MAVEIKETTQKGVKEATRGTVIGADLVTGAVVATADAITHPVETAHELEARGAKVNKAIANEVEDAFEDIGEAAAPLLPERLLLAGVGAVKARARRRDLLGSIAYRWLELVNGGIESLNGVVDRFERATEPPARHGEVRRPLRATVRRTTRRASAAARSTAGSARRGAASARRAESRS